METSRMKSLSVIILIIALAITMASCGNSNSNNSGNSNSSDKELNILCFQGYAEPTWVDPFEKETGIKVNATYAGTVEEMFTKAAAGGTVYDIVSIDCGAVQRYYDAGLIDPIDIKKLSNYNKLSTFFKDADYKVINDAVYQIPICWGATIPVYNMDKLPDLPQTWQVMWDPQYKNQVSIADEANNNVIIAAISLGFSDPYNLTDEQFGQVRERLTAIAENCRTFTNGFDNEYQVLSSGETIISIGYDSMLIMKLRDNDGMTVGRLMPKEGMNIWIDGWVLMKNAEHKDAALKYIDWMISDSGQYELAKVVGFGAVTPAAKDAIDPDVARLTSYDNIDNVKVPLFVMQNPENFEKRVELWDEIKAGL